MITISKFYYQGHGSYRLETNSGKIIFVDPFCGDGYDKKADLILITHNHFDHTKTQLVEKNENCDIITYKEALKNNNYNIFKKDEITIISVQAYNENHPISECVGYVLQFDNICFYASGDTSETNDMKTKLPNLNIDYAVLPIDGVFNMDIKEAKECAELIKAKHIIPIHTTPLYDDEVNENMLFDEEKAKKLDIENKLTVKPGKEIIL